MNQDLVEVYRCFDPGEAHIVRSFLESRGIPCVLLDEHHNTVNWVVQVSLGGYKIAVLSNYANEAILLLNEYKGFTEPASDKAPWLPEGTGSLLSVVLSTILYFVTGAFLFRKNKTVISDQKVLPHKPE